jgi:Arc/MetJ-type ribon-helix-helix transcriptional regulator
MNPSIAVTHKVQKKRGRPPTGETPGRSIRLPEELWKAIDEFRRGEEDIPVRSEAVRRLVTRALEAEAAKKGRKR